MYCEQREGSANPSQRRYRGHGRGTSNCSRLRIGVQTIPSSPSPTHPETQPPTKWVPPANTRNHHRVRAEPHSQRARAHRARLSTTERGRDPSAALGDANSRSRTRDAQQQLRNDGLAGLREPCICCWWGWPAPWYEAQEIPPTPPWRRPARDGRGRYSFPSRPASSNAERKCGWQIRDPCSALRRAAKRANMALRAAISMSIHAMNGARRPNQPPTIVRAR